MGGACHRREVCGFSITHGMFSERHSRNKDTVACMSLFPTCTFISSFGDRSGSPMICCASRSGPGPRPSARRAMLQLAQGVPNHMKASRLARSQPRIRRHALSLVRSCSRPHRVSHSKQPGACVSFARCRQAREKWPLPLKTSSPVRRCSRPAKATRSRRGCCQSG